MATHNHVYTDRAVSTQATYSTFSRQSLHQAYQYRSVKHAGPSMHHAVVHVDHHQRWVCHNATQHTAVECCIVFLCSFTCIAEKAVDNLHGVRGCFLHATALCSRCALCTTHSKGWVNLSPQLPLPLPHTSCGDKRGVGMVRTASSGGINNSSSSSSSNCIALTTCDTRLLHCCLCHREVLKVTREGGEGRAYDVLGLE